MLGYTNVRPSTRISFQALLGEADLLTGQLTCPRTPPDTIASFAGVEVPEEEWLVQGVCAYVPQVRSVLLLTTRLEN